MLSPIYNFWRLIGMELSTYCYHSNNGISLPQFQCDHIKGLPQSWKSCFSGEIKIHTRSDYYRMRPKNLDFWWQRWKRVPEEEKRFLGEIFSMIWKLYHCRLRNQQSDPPNLIIQPEKGSTPTWVPKSVAFRRSQIFTQCKCLDKPNL